MSAFDLILERARSHPRRIVLPEASDDRVLQAAAESSRLGLARPILLASPDALEAQGDRLGLDLEGCQIVDPTEAGLLERATAFLMKKRRDRGMTPGKARQALSDPVTLGCAMLGTGDAEGCVAGALCSTATVVNAALRYVGTDDDTVRASSCFVMLMSPHHPVEDVLMLADCALIIDPDEQELADIAITTGETARQLMGMTPELAMLSFSTDGSARHAAVRKVRKATAIVRERRSHWRVVGETQLDAAVIPSILQHKAPAQATESPCNVLIFPDLNAGNIGYKLLERFGGATAVGPILQGLRQPVNDLSRGCTASDIVHILAVTAAQVR